MLLFHQSKDEFTKKVFPELRSRFGLKYQIVLLTDEEKQKYLSFKVQYYLDKVESEFGIYPNAEQLERSLMYLLISIRT